MADASRMASQDAKEKNTSTSPTHAERASSRPSSIAHFVFKPSSFYSTACPVRIRYDMYDCLVGTRAERKSDPPGGTLQKTFSPKSEQNMRNGVEFENYVVQKVLHLPARSCPEGCRKAGSEACEGLERFFGAVEKSRRDLHDARRQHEAAQQQLLSPGKCWTEWVGTIPQLHLYAPPALHAHLLSKGVFPSECFADLVKVGYRHYPHDSKSVSGCVVVQVIDLKYAASVKRYHQQQIACYLLYLTGMLRAHNANLELLYTFDPSVSRSTAKTPLLLEGVVWLPTQHQPNGEGVPHAFTSLSEGVKAHRIKDCTMAAEVKSVEHFLQEVLPSHYQHVSLGLQREQNTSGGGGDVRASFLFPAPPTRAPLGQEEPHPARLQDIEEANLEWPYDPGYCRHCSHQQRCETELLRRMRDNLVTVRTAKDGGGEGRRLLPHCALPAWFHLQGGALTWNPYLLAVVFCMSGNGVSALWDGDLATVLERMRERVLEPLYYTPGEALQCAVEKFLDSEWKEVVAHVNHRNARSGEREEEVCWLGCTSGRMAFLKRMDDSFGSDHIQKRVSVDSQCLVPDTRTALQLQWLFHLCRAPYLIPSDPPNNRLPGFSLSFWQESRTAPGSIWNGQTYEYTHLNCRLFTLDRILTTVLNIPWSGVKENTPSPLSDVIWDVIAALSSNAVSAATNRDAPALRLFTAATVFLKRSSGELNSSSSPLWRPPAPYFGKSEVQSLTLQIQNCISGSLLKPRRDGSSIMLLLYAMLLHDITAALSTENYTDVYADATPVTCMEMGSTSISAVLETSETLLLESVVADAIAKQRKNKKPKLNPLPPIKMELLYWERSRLLPCQWVCSPHHTTQSPHVPLVLQAIKEKLPPGKAFLLPVADYKAHMYDLLIKFAMRVWNTSSAGKPLLLAPYLTARRASDYSTKSSTYLDRGYAPLTLRGHSKPTAEQQKVLESVRGECPLTIVWGPPGTGKTATLAAVICHLFRYPSQRTANGPRVLLTGPTNAAIHVLYTELLKYQEEQLLPSTVTLVPLHKDAQDKKITGFGKYSGGTNSIIFSTVFGCQSKILNSDSPCTDLSFDVLIIDEGSMVPVPHAGLTTQLLSVGYHTIIVAGDVLQLPPIQSAMPSANGFSEGVDCQTHLLRAAFPEMKHVIADVGSTSILQSLFGPRASDGKHLTSISELKEFMTTPSGLTLPPHVVQLSKSFRSVPCIVDLIAHLYPVKLSSLLPQNCSGKVQYVIVSSTAGPLSVRAPALDEAETVVRLLEELYTQRPSPETRGPYKVIVATPHRAQRFTIQAAITRSAVLSPRHEGMEIQVDTVERTQGSEADCVVLCYGPAVRLDTGFGYHLCRMNVAVSRAKTRVVLLVDAAKAALLGAHPTARHESAAQEPLPDPVSRLPPFVLFTSDSAPATGCNGDLAHHPTAQRSAHLDIAAQGWELLRHLFQSCEEIRFP